MNIKKIGIDRKYTSFDELFNNHIVAQGWPYLGDLSFAYTAQDSSRDMKFQSFICTTISEKNATHTFRQLLKEIKSHDIILAFEGNTIKGITEIPDDYIYFYNEEMEEYRNCLYPVQWVRWEEFCNDKKLFYQGGQGVRGIVNAGDSEITDYINIHWEEFKKQKRLNLQPPDCQERLEELKNNFPIKQIDSEKAFYKRLLNNNNIIMMHTITNLIKKNKNIILQGAPGTGKTYSTAELALSIIDNSYDTNNVMEKYEILRNSGQIEFVTFHQSMDYEDFIEGLKPSVENGSITYKVEEGVFKRICQKAKGNPDKNFVLIIDEINRGNVSKIFGELISLLEADKRIGNSDGHPLTARLPYSKGEPFGVPFNLYIIGTMNTTDRSVGSIDYAIRRRFVFFTLKSDRAIVESSYIDEEKRHEALRLFDAVKNFVTKTKTDMDIDDLMVGHSYFMNKGEDIQQKWDYAILPLLTEYYRDGICSKSPEKDMVDFINKYIEE